MTQHFNLRAEKKDLLDVAFSRFNNRSAAELGCVWGVECAYGLYALKQFTLASVKMIDTRWTESALKKVRNHPEIEVFEEDFGSPHMPRLIGNVDAVILFDVLLHQVAPDWDRVLQMYAPYTTSFVIFNPQWLGTSISVRLMDLGRDEYFKNVPHSPDHPTYAELFQNMYAPHPTHKKIWRDVHHVWQWGITTPDLIFTLDRLGFCLEYYRAYGRMRELLNFSEQAFVFRKNFPEPQRAAP